MNHSSLADSVLIAQDIKPQVSSANVNGAAAIDMSGWDGCAFIFNLGAMASGATFDARIVSSANANMSGNTNVTNAAVVQVANTGNTNVVVIDLYRPTDRYLRSAVVPGTDNVNFSCITVRYRRSGILPVTQSVAQVVRVVSN